MTTFFYPVEITGNPTLPPERSFFFIEVEADTSFDAFCEGSRQFKALFPDHTRRVACTRWWPHEGECPSVEYMLELKREMAEARGNLRSRHSRRVREAHAQLLSA